MPRYTMSADQQRSQSNACLYQCCHSLMQFVFRSQIGKYDSVFSEGEPWIVTLFTVEEMLIFTLGNLLELIKYFNWQRTPVCISSAHPFHLTEHRIIPYTLLSHALAFRRQSIADDFFDQSSRATDVLALALNLSMRSSVRREHIGYVKVIIGPPFRT